MPTLLSFFVDRYCQKATIAAGSPRTVTAYRNDVDRFRQWHRERHGREPELLDLTPAGIESAMAWQLARGRKKPTANKLRRHLVAVRNYAVRCGELPPLAPTEVVESVKEPHREPDCWSMGQWETILEAATRLRGSVGEVPAAVWWEALLRTVYNTGARISAVMGIRCDLVDLAGGVLLIHAEIQKDAEDQRVTLLPRTVAALQALGAHGRVPRLFDDWPHDRAVVQWPALNRGLKRLLVDAGLFSSPADVTRRDLWHKIRRTFATAITAKAGMAVAQSMLGHSSLDVTKRYVDRSKLDVPSAARLLVDPAPMALRLFTPAASG